MKKKLILTLLIVVIIIVAILLYQASQKDNFVPRIKFISKNNVPHKECPYLLQSYLELVATEQNAKDLLNNWIRSEYTAEEIGQIKIEEVFQEDVAFYLSLTTALPQKENHIGYKFYKIENGQIFGLYCFK